MAEKGEESGVRKRDSEQERETQREERLRGREGERDGDVVAERSRCEVEERMKSEGATSIACDAGASRH